MAERRALHWLRVAGSVAVALFVVFQVVNPRRPVVAGTPGFRDPVAAFELASTPEHVLGILGRAGDPARAEQVRRMVVGLRLDFLFLLAYPTFTAAIAVLLVARGAPRWLAPAVIVLAVAMALGDALENRELLALTRTVDPGEMLGPLARLRVFTLVKWYAVYAAAGLVALFVWRERGWWRWSGPLFAVAAGLGIASLAYLPAIEWGMAPIAVAWIMTYARSFARAGA